MTNKYLDNGVLVALDEMYKRTDCEVSKRTLRVRLDAGEPYSKARKLRNFIVYGKKYKNLWEFSKDTSPRLTYSQLKYRICVLKMTPTEAEQHELAWVAGRRVTGKRTGTQRTLKTPYTGLSCLEPTS